MIIIGIDPAKTTGFAIVRCERAARPDLLEWDEVSCQGPADIYQETRRTFALTLRHRRPKEAIVIAVEIPPLNYGNAHTHAVLNWKVGAVMVCAAILKTPCETINCMEAKAIAGGQSKEHVRRAMCHKLKREIESEHVADACAVALALWERIQRRKEIPS